MFICLPVFLYWPPFSQFKSTCYYQRQFWMMSWNSQWLKVEKRKIVKFEFFRIEVAIFFNVGPPEEEIYLTTFYGLYFSHHFTLITNYNLSHVGPLWAAFSWTSSTPVFLTCGYSSCFYFCFNTLIIVKLSVWIGWGD